MSSGFWVQFIGAMLVVLGLLAGLALALRFLERGRLTARLTGRGREMRIAEVLPLDGRRRLVLVEHRGVGYLLMLGLRGEVVVAGGLSLGRELSAPEGVGEAG